MEYFASHPTLDMLELHILTRLDSEDQTNLSKHLKGCPPCNRMSKRLREQIELIQEAMLAAAV